MEQLVVDLPAWCADEVGHDEDRRRNAFALQNRERMLVVVPVPIVEGDGGDVFGEGPAGGQMLADVVERGESEMAADQVEVPLEHCRAGQHARHLATRADVEVFDDAVIPEDERALRPPRQCFGEAQARASAKWSTRVRS